MGQVTQNEHDALRAEYDALFKEVRAIYELAELPIPVGNANLRRWLRPFVEPEHAVEPGHVWETLPDGVQTLRKLNS